MVHLEDLVRCFFDLQEQGKKLAEVRLPLLVNGGLRPLNFMECHLVLREEIPQMMGFLFFSWKRDVVQLDLERLFKKGFVFPDELGTLVVLPRER